MLKVDLDRSINEKDVENTYRAGFLSEIKDCRITSPHGGDGLLETKDLRVMMEFKFDHDLKNKLHQCNILIQCIYYLKKYELNGAKLPSVIFVGDRNECFAMHVNDVMKYLSFDIDWNIAPSEAHKRNPDLLMKMMDDPDILPFIFDVDEKFTMSKIVEKLGDFSENVVRKVRITKMNIVNIFDYFDGNVLGDKFSLGTNDRANLFVQIIINPDENYLHPKKNNTLITKNFGDLAVKSNPFKAFFSHFEGDLYSPKEKEEMTALVDRLIEDTTRRRNGEFFTPTPFVDLAHEYISKTFGEDWKERFVVWDPAWGTGNLTRDYKFKELYCSTLNQSDIDTADAMGYNPEAVKFQFDFLNDGDDKLPEGLRKALEDGREVLFLMNPPYARAGNIDLNSAEIGSTDTIVREQMKSDNWGACSANLYAQFFYKIWKYQQINNNCHISTFSPSLFMSGESFKTFRKNFLQEFKIIDGFYFQASHFSNVSTKWGIVFTVFSNESTSDKTKFIYNSVDLDIDNFYLTTINKKTVYNVDYQTKANDWVRSETKNLITIEAPPLTSSIKVATRAKTGLVEGAIGFIFNGSNNVNKNATEVSILSSVFSDAKGISIVKENLKKILNLFAARKTIISTWENSKDEYLAPNEQHPSYEQFSNDAIVYSLFNNSSQQSSLRQITYKDKLWDIENEFFWMSKDEMTDLANAHNFDELYKDARTSDDRYVHKLLFKDGIYDKLSPDAKEVLDMATDLMKRSMDIRKMMASSNPEYHLASWDAGYAQMKLVWKEYFKDDFNLFRKKYKELEDRMRPLVYELGFLLKDDLTI